MITQKLNSAILVVALLVACALVVVLGLQNRSLRADIRELAALARDPHPGFVVPPVALEAVNGDPVRLGEAATGHFQLVFVFATNSEPCRTSLPAWNMLTEELVRYPRVQVVGVSTDSVRPTREFVAEHGIGFPVVSFVDRKLRTLYRSQLIPQTLLLNADGVVRYARLGPVEDGVVFDSVMAQVELATSSADTGDLALDWPLEARESLRTRR